MAPTSASTATRESTPAPDPRTSPRRAPTPRPAPPTDLPGSTNPRPGSPSDDEILGLDSRSAGILPANFVDGDAHENRQLEAGATDLAVPADASTESTTPTSSIPESLRAALDANPDLRSAWDEAQAYRETFASPEEARQATAVLADIDRMDALFFSRRPEDHAELARAVAALDPAAFASLAQAMTAQINSQSRARDGVVGAQHAVPGKDAWHDSPDPAPSPAENASLNGATLPSNDAGRSSATPLQSSSQPTPTQAQSDFFHATNAAAVQSVVDAIETQVERLLPENISKSARNRVVGEIYRELDTTLRSNRQLAQQMRDALRSGSLDADHQRAVVSLVTGRVRQALPGVAKRVLNEWTSTVVAAHNDRRARQQAAERRIDIAGSNGTGSDGPRSMTPCDVDYKRMSDSDILNL